MVRSSTAWRSKCGADDARFRTAIERACRGDDRERPNDDALISADSAPKVAGVDRTKRIVDGLATRLPDFRGNT